MFGIGSLLSVGLNLLHVLAPLFGLVFISARATGTPRRLGIVGCVLLIISGVVQTAFVLALPALGGRLSRSYGLVSFVSGANSLLALGGLIVLICAVAASRSGQPDHRPNTGHPGPQGGWPQQPPYSG